MEDKYEIIFKAIDEAKMRAKERNSLPDSAFGLPEDRKYPLTDKAHIKSAIKLFGHCPENKKKQLAKRIASAARRNKITISNDSEVAKYLSK